MSDREPRLEELIELIVEQRVSYLHTSLPAKVVTFTAAENKASVQPLIKDSFVDDDGNNVAEDLPVISDVPIHYPRGDGGNFSMTWPLQPDDIVMLVFTERSMDRWIGGDDPTQSVDPTDLRKHQLSDCWAVPGVYPFGSSVPVDTDKVTFTFGNTVFKIADGQIQLGGTGDKASLDSKVQQQFSDVATAITQIVSYINSHLHLNTYLAPLLPLPGPPVPVIPVPPTPPSTANYTPGATASNLVTIEE